MLQREIIFNHGKILKKNIYLNEDLRCKVEFFSMNKWVLPTLQIQMSQFLMFKKFGFETATYPPFCTMSWNILFFFIDGVPKSCYEKVLHLKFETCFILLCLDEYCVFPFKVSNLTITGCTKVDGDTTAWCATKVDSQVHQKLF